jgi:transposase
LIGDVIRLLVPSAIEVMKKTTSRLKTIKRIPDDMWSEIAPFLGDEKKRGTRGRPPVPFRKVMDGILYVLRTGTQWKEPPKEYGSGTTAHRRFQQWVAKGVFQRTWVRLLEKYDERRGIKWKWQSLDSSSVKAPLVGKRLALTLQTGGSSAPRGTSSRTKEGRPSPRSSRRPTPTT